MALHYGSGIHIQLYIIIIELRYSKLVLTKNELILSASSSLILIVYILLLAPSSHTKQTAAFFHLRAPCGCVRSLLRQTCTNPHVWLNSAVAVISSRIDPLLSSRPICAACMPKMPNRPLRSSGKTRVRR